MANALANLAKKLAYLDNELISIEVKIFHIRMPINLELIESESHEREVTIAEGGLEIN